ncbi:MAG TPA: transposase [Acidobacteriaceae bacterium]|nr:transposase [Acidobacteriaceae bacterium]
MAECNQEAFGFAPHLSRRINLLGRLAGCFSDGRRPLLVKHKLAEMLAQRLYGLTLAYEDLKDHEQVRNDPLWAYVASGRWRSHWRVRAW